MLLLWCMIRTWCLRLNYIVLLCGTGKTSYLKILVDLSSGFQIKEYRSRLFVSTIWFIGFSFLLFWYFVFWRLGSIFLLFLIWFDYYFCTIFILNTHNLLILIYIPEGTFPYMFIYLTKPVGPNFLGPQISSGDRNKKCCLQNAN